MHLYRFDRLLFVAISTYLRIGRRLNDKPLRPFFPPDMVDLADPSLTELAEKCWSENPRERPRLSAIKECVKAAAANMYKFLTCCFFLE